MLDAKPDLPTGEGKKIALVLESKQDVNTKLHHDFKIKANKHVYCDSDGRVVNAGALIKVVTNDSETYVVLLHDSTKDKLQQDGSIKPFYTGTGGSVELEQVKYDQSNGKN